MISSELTVDTVNFLALVANQDIVNLVLFGRRLTQQQRTKADVTIKRFYAKSDECVPKMYNYNISFIYELVRKFFFGNFSVWFRFGFGLGFVWDSFGFRLGFVPRFVIDQQRQDVERNRFIGFIQWRSPRCCRRFSFSASFQQLSERRRKRQ
jgi:hypothetical protein